MVNPSLSTSFKESGSSSSSCQDACKKASDTDKQADGIENATLSIFIHLCSLADGKERKSIEAAIAPIDDVINSLKLSDDDAINSPKLSENPKLNLSQRRRHFPYPYKDTNFDYNDFEDSIHTGNVIHNLFTRFAEIFLGWRFIRSGEETKSIEQLRKRLSNDHTFWEKNLKKFYTESFQISMNEIFKKAEKVLEDRSHHERRAFLQRVTFYASLIISIVGKLLKQPTFTRLGIAAASITLIFMVTNPRYFEQTAKETDLKNAIDLACKQGRSHRLDSQTNC
jgi:hypothetical protein